MSKTFKNVLHKKMCNTFAQQRHRMKYRFNRLVILNSMGVSGLNCREGTFWKKWQLNKNNLVENVHINVLNKLCVDWVRFWSKQWMRNIFYSSWTCIDLSTKQFDIIDYFREW